MSCWQTMSEVKGNVRPPKFVKCIDEKRHWTQKFYRIVDDSIVAPIEETTLKGTNPVDDTRNNNSFKYNGDWITIR